MEIRPTDIRWPGPYHIEEGPDCLCSRCGQPILEPDIAIRGWPEDANAYSYRFHPACLGMRTADTIIEAINAREQASLEALRHQSEEDVC